METTKWNEIETRLTDIGFREHAAKAIVEFWASAGPHGEYSADDFKAMDVKKFRDVAEYSLDVEMVEAGILV